MARNAREILLLREIYVLNPNTAQIISNLKLVFTEL